VNAYLFLLLGLLFVYWEFFLPGAILGIAGTIIIIASLVLAVAYGQSLAEILVFFAIAIVGVVAVIRIALYRVRYAKKGTSVYLSMDQTGFQASSYDVEAIGKVGVALTDLRPGGAVLVDGKKSQAISKEGYISKGSAILVLSGEGDTLTVILSKENPA